MDSKNPAHALEIDLGHTARGFTNRSKHTISTACRGPRSIPCRLPQCSFRVLEAPIACVNCLYGFSHHDHDPPSLCSIELLELGPVLCCRSLTFLWVGSVNWGAFLGWRYIPINLIMIDTCTVKSSVWWNQFSLKFVLTCLSLNQSCVWSAGGLRGLCMFWVVAAVGVFEDVGKYLDK